MWFIATPWSQYSSLFLALLFIISPTSLYYVVYLLTVLRDVKINKFLNNFLACYTSLFPGNQSLRLPCSCLTFFVLQTSQKNFLLSSREPRTSCSSLNWLHGSPTMVLLQDKKKKIEIKIYSNSYCEKYQEKDRQFYVELASLDFLMPTHMGIPNLSFLAPKKLPTNLNSPLKKAPPVFLHKLSDLYRGTVRIYCSSDALKLHENRFLLT